LKIQLAKYERLYSGKAAVSIGEASKKFSTKYGAAIQRAGHA